MSRGREVQTKPEKLRRAGMIDEMYLRAPAGGLAPFFDDRTLLPKAPPSRPRFGDET